MKKLLFLIVAIVVLGLIVTGCIPVVPPTEQSEPTSLTRGLDKTYYVATDGSDAYGDGTETWVDNAPIGWGPEDTGPWLTISHAISQAALTGDTINIADGIYTITAAINVNKSVTIIGNITNPENVVVKYSPASSTLNCVEVNSADVTIQGIKVQDCKNGFHFDRNVNTNTGVTISNCIIESVIGWGIGEVSSPNTVISHNTITTAGDKGIYFRYCEGTSESNRCEAISNVISGCGQSAIQTFGSKYTYIYDNTISSTNDKGINIIRSGAAGTADRVQVIGNTISETKWPGIQVIGAPYTYIYDNTLTNCNYYGGDGTGDWDYASIHVQDDGAVSGDHVIIDSNTVSDGINGIQTWSNDVTITNNEIYDMGVTYADDKTVGIRTYKNSGILVGSNWGLGDIDPIGVVIQCNNIHDNYWGLFYSADLMNGVTATHNWWGHATGPYNFSTNPLGLGDAVSDNVNYDNWAYIPDFCDCEAKTIGYWKNHPDYVDGILLELDYSIEVGTGKFVGVVVYAEDIFTKPHSKTYSMLAAQLLAAKLNVAQLSQFIPGYNSDCMSEEIEKADFILRLVGGHPYSERVEKDDKEYVNGVKDELDEFNNNEVCQVQIDDCPCECY